jgi:hypothetical protein
MSDASCLQPKGVNISREGKEESKFSTTVNEFPFSSGINLFYPTLENKLVLLAACVI